MITLSILLISFISLILDSNASNATISVDDILALNQTLWQKFKEGGALAPLAATTVRLAFDDCGGFPEDYNVNGTKSICNGCIDFSNDAHKGFNDANGVVDQLEDIFLNQGPEGVDDITKWTDKMSLADFWMAAATIAIQHTHANSVFNTVGPNTLPIIPFYFGRSECSTSPDFNTTLTNSLSKQFPGGTDPWDVVETWFEENFNFTIEEIVALLGAHALGIKHLNVSEMSNSWVATSGQFDNRFYIDLIARDWVQQSNGQWDAGSNSMMNVDIGLWKYIENELNTTNSAVGCVFDECPSNNETAEFVQAFADDNELWLQTFVPAWIKMITVGYDIDDDLTEIIINVDETTAFPEPGTTVDETEDDDDEFEIVEWLTDNWYFVVGGVVGLILLIVLIVCCCKMSKKRQEKRNRDVEMFGTHPV